MKRILFVFVALGLLVGCDKNLFESDSDTTKYYIEYPGVKTIIDGAYTYNYDKKGRCISYSYSPSENYE